MSLNKVGYDLPGNAFHVVPRDLTTGKQEFGSVTAEFTLWERTVPSAGSRSPKEMEVELSFPVGTWLRGVGNTPLSLSWDFYGVGPSWEGKSLPVRPSSCCILHGDKRESPKAGCVPWDPVPSWEKGHRAGRDQSSCAWASQPRGESWQCPAAVGRVLLWRMHLLE